MTLAEEGNEEERKEEQKEDEEDGERSQNEDWAVFKAEGVAIQLNLREKLEKGRQENVGEKRIDDDQAERFFIGMWHPSSIKKDNAS